MFERFTQRARNVVVLAQEEVRRFNHNYLGTEHLLLGLLRDDEGVAARALAAIDVTADKVREQVEGIVGYGEEEAGGQVPFTPRSKKVLELALRESMQLGHNYIGTEHLLLGMMQDGEGVASKVLVNLGVPPYGLYEDVVRMLGAEPGLEPPDQVERGMEPEFERNQMLFRGRVTSLQINTRLGDRQQKLLVDLEYAYAVRDSGEPSESLEHDELLDGVVACLQGRTLGSIEAGISEAGELVLHSFPAVREISISATRERQLEGGAASSITVIRTFRR